MLLRAAVRWRTVAAAGGACAARAWARCEEDLYATLGVGRKASAEEIRRAYKLRAAKAHPDHGGDAEEFKRVAAAYAALPEGDWKARRRALAGLIGGAPDAPAAQPRPASGGLFAGLFSGLGGAKPVAGTKGGEPAGAVASRASKAKVDALYRRRPRS
ncbi:DnaJ molecular chaperone [Aureococcus anophagefferens]|uniref:DnaJ molecular chaperone n=1 Tax=Aureococcus anophagefferens TaxID=44056 RepID=A0ABR1GD41_AURAN